MKTVVEPSNRDFVAQHAELLGRVAIAWNDLNEILRLLFIELSGLPEEKADAIYFAPRSDTTQRDLLRAVAEVALRSKPALWSALSSCLNDINKLAGERNAATHTCWSIAIPEMTFVPSPRVPAHKALRSDFATQFEDLKTRLGNKFYELDEIRKQLLKQS